jgi:hypothetical protein
LDGDCNIEEMLVQPLDSDEHLICIYTEKMIELADGPSSVQSTPRIAEDEELEVPVKEVQVTLLLTDAGLYIIDQQEILAKEYVFLDAPAFTVMRSHPLYTLR